MSVTCLSLLGMWGAVVAVWAGLLVAQIAARRRGLLLEAGGLAPVPEQPKAVLPSVCVIVPARNEQDNLPACLQSLLAQDYPSLRAIVVDDRSTDGTADLVRAWADQDGRLSLESVPALPPGWLGKSNALWHGAARACADWLLFLDADCALEPSAVRVALEEAQRRDADLLSLWPRQSPGTFWEHMLIPLCAGIIALWFGSKRVNQPGSGVAFANGQFLLIRREAYERIDGHRAVRDALIEDIPLAEHAKRAGLRCWVCGGRELASVRMYTSLAGIAEGWARIYVGALRSGGRIAVSFLWLAVGSLWPFVAALALAGAWLGWWPQLLEGLGSCRPWATGLCLAHLALLIVVSYRFWGLGGCKRVYLWLYPVTTVMVIGILLRAWWWLAVKRRVRWRGVSYLIDRNGCIKPDDRNAVCRNA